MIISLRFDIAINKKLLINGGREMTNEELYAMTKKAVMENEMLDYLQGNGDYKCPPDKYLPAFIPTDFSVVLNQGIYDYYIETKDKKIVNDLEKALEELCNGDAIQIWIAYSYFWSIIYSQIKGNIPFEFDCEKIRKILEEKVTTHEIELKGCKEWNGWNEEEGLWEDIRRSNHVMKTMNNYTIIEKM